MRYLPPDPQISEQETNMRMHKQERRSGKNLFQGKQLSRQASVLLQLSVILLIIAAAAVGCHFLH